MSSDAKIHCHEARTYAQLLDALKHTQPSGLVFFWGHTRRSEHTPDTSSFSNWYPAPVKIKQTQYPTTEHHMMAEKARCFGDDEMFKKILEAKTPLEAKKLGREVRNFDANTWDARAFDVVLEGNMAKFSQHKALAEVLNKTGDDVIVEASPYDAIWGIGLQSNHPDAFVPQNWRGLNKLGFVLMQVRAALR